MRLVSNKAAELGAFSDRRKQLGQYFSGLGVGRLLAAVGRVELVDSVVDPMAGSGDLLAACLELNPSIGHCAGIEIEAAYARHAASRLPSASIIAGSAFDANINRSLASRGWDLVIANPPYVRYQRNAVSGVSRGDAPTPMQVRTGLLAAIACSPNLTSGERRDFSILASSYSGFADLAVPSWILCASLVRPGGRMALVVPDAWLTRDYSSAVKYMLLRWFDIECVVEDEHAIWFADALVKTNLVVARRVVDKRSFRTEGRFRRILIGSRAFGSGSPIGATELFGREKDAAQSLLERRPVGSRADGITIDIESTGPLIDSLDVKQPSWLAQLELKSNNVASVTIPHALRRWIDERSAAISFAPLSQHVSVVGQGLRTGANDFFYCEEVEKGNGFTTVESKLVSNGLLVKVPTPALRTVLRRQADLPRGYVVSARSLVSRLLYLREFALAEDRRGNGRAVYELMPRSLAKLVRIGASVVSDSGVALPEWSAVKVNSRAAIKQENVPPRFWYMLPALAPRHLPDVVIPRVNGAAVKAFVVARGVVVDANFTTLVTKPVGPSKYALCAFLNSAWARALFETLGTVLGGGALKLEATHVRSMPVPLFSDLDWCKLSDLGKRLRPGAVSVQREIDAIVLARALGRKGTSADLESLCAIGDKGVARRRE